MAPKAVEVQGDCVVALITESLPASVTTSTTVESDFTPVSVADKFLSDFLQEIHMMEPHVFRLPNAFLVFWIRTF